MQAAHEVGDALLPLSQTVSSTHKEEIQQPSNAIIPSMNVNVMPRVMEK
jgi:hypothetical protein